jgi:GMP reductase
MPTILKSESIYYNDINLLGRPAPDHIKSRSDIPKEKYRIVVSPMHALQGEKFVEEAAKNGISIFIHRFLGLDWQLKMNDIFQKNKIDSRQVCCLSMGLKNLKEEFLELYIKNGIRSLGIDIANGFLNLQEQARFIRNSMDYCNNGLLDNFYVGNINTAEGFQKLQKTFDCIAKNLIIRVGVGGGQACSSSDVASINRGNITEIIECHSVSNNGLVAADGGISKPGFAAKAFAAGSEYILMGGYFSYAEEAETNLNGDKSYWGGSSQKQLEILGQTHKTSEGKVISGVNKELKPMKKLVDDLWGGLASYVTYSGYGSLTEAIGNGLFEVKRNSLPPKGRI